MHRSAHRNVLRKKLQQINACLEIYVLDSATTSDREKKKAPDRASKGILA